MNSLILRVTILLAVIGLGLYLYPFLFGGGLMARCDGEHLEEVYRSHSINGDYVLVRADNVCKDGRISEALVYVLRAPATDLSSSNLICVAYPPRQTLKAKWAADGTLVLFSSDQQGCRYTGRLPSHIRFVFSNS